MSLARAGELLSQFEEARPIIMPNLWTEPLIAANFKEHMRQMREKGFPIALNTNGLKLDDEMAAFLTEIGVSSVFVSIDATTPEILLKTRGTDKLDLICESVFRMLRARGNASTPRVGVSFTVEEVNAHQREEAVHYWLESVDVVRVNEKYDRSGRVAGQADDESRPPCKAIYHSLAVHFNGNVSICCLDAYQKTNLGNVFEDGGPLAVWHGPKFTHVRECHEAGRWDDVPFCKDCDVWRSHEYRDEIREGLLIRSSPLITYYNRLDRLENWEHEHNGPAIQQK